MFYVYGLITADKKIYIGSTNDLIKRVKKHNSGDTKYLVGRLPIKLDFYISTKTEQKARELEKYLKTGSGFAFRNKHFI